MKLGTTKVTEYKLKMDEEEMMTRLTNLALDFNAGRGSSTISDHDESLDMTAIVENVRQSSGKSNIENFDVENFFKFVSNDFEKQHWEYASLHE